MTILETKHWTENWRALTPVLVTIAIFMLGCLLSTTNKIDEKLFKHLTNEEIHCPRSLVTSKAEFELLKQVRDKELDGIRELVKYEFQQLRIEIRNPLVYKK